MNHIPYIHKNASKSDIEARSKTYFEHLNARRSVRFFTDEPVPKSVIENILKSAGTAPSGANKQPWFFVAVADKNVKKTIREAAEIEEREFYENRATEEWLKDLEPIGTNWQKPFIETAPWIIVVFKQLYGVNESGKTKNYYVQESVGLACGLLISAIHDAGLVTLTHTPSPMNFLAEILNRPDNEKPFLLLPVGYPAAGATVPNISRKPLNEIAHFIE